SPVFQKDLLLLGGLMMKLDADKPGGSILWPQTARMAKRVLSNTSTPLLLDGNVYSARSNGEFVYLDGKTGEQVWQIDKVTDLKGGASVHLTPNGDSVFLYNERGELILA